MLKVTYTETGLYLEQVNYTLEEWISLRAVLALRTKQSLVIEHSCASILLPKSPAHLALLKQVLAMEQAEAIDVSNCDAEYIEVSLPGTWLTLSLDETEGTFVTALSLDIEKTLLQLWQISQLNSPLMEVKKTI